jgi:hypothetical protein
MPVWLCLLPMLRYAKLSYFGLLKGFKEADYIGALIYAGIVNQVSCSVWAVDFVAF